LIVCVFVEYELPICSSITINLPLKEPINRNQKNKNELPSTNEKTLSKHRIIFWDSIQTENFCKT